MPNIYTEAAEFMEHRGIRIYHVHNGNDYEQGVRQYQYSLDPDSDDETADEEYRNFDVREMPAFEPFIGRAQVHVEDIRRVLRESIDRGDLNDLIVAAITEGLVDMDVAARCSSCGAESDLNVGDLLGTACGNCKRGTVEVKIKDPEPLHDFCISQDDPRQKAIGKAYEPLAKLGRRRPSDVRLVRKHEGGSEVIEMYEPGGKLAAVFYNEQFLRTVMEDTFGLDVFASLPIEEVK